MIKILKKVVDFWHCLNKPYNHKQYQLFQQIQIGDIIYAKTPITKEQIANVDEAHINRPFIVVRKKKNRLLVYELSSVNKKKWKETDYYKQYRKNKMPSYIYLMFTMALPIENIIAINGKLNERILMRIDKRLLIANKNRKNKLPRFNVKLRPERGDIIHWQGNEYLVLNYFNGKYMVNMIDRTSGHHSLMLKNRDKYYYLDYLNDQILHIEEQVEYIDIISLEKVKSIQRSANADKRKMNLPYTRYQIGMTFYLGASDYLYLYHVGNKMYGLEYDDEYIDTSISIIKNVEYLKPGEKMDVEEVKGIMEMLIDLKQDRFKVLTKQLQMLN